MAYGDATAYAKYLKKKISSGCSGCSEGESSSTDCECCPAGLVQVNNPDGTRSGCLTPQDAEEYLNGTRSCSDGFVALYKESPTPAFRGCVSETEFAALYEALNPTP